MSPPQINITQNQPECEFMRFETMPDYTMFSVLLFALVAAVLGGLDSPVGAVVGGLTLGVVKNLAGTYVPSSVGGTDLTIALGIIVLVLMVRPTGIFGRLPQRRV